MFRFLIAMSALFCLYSGQAAALSVSPMSLRIDPSQGSGYSTVVAKNTSDKTVALEIYVERRDVDSAGNLVITRSDDDIIVFPPLASVAPGASQAFRIQWIGEAGAQAAGNFYVTVYKLPVDLEQAKANAGPRVADESRILLRLGYAFRVAVAVVPASARSNLRATIIGPGRTLSDGRPSLAVQFVNDGTGYAHLRQYEYLLSRPDGQRIATSFAQWGEQAGTSLFPVGHARTVNIPVPEVSWTSGVTLDVRPTR